MSRLALLAPSLGLALVVVVGCSNPAGRCVTGMAIDCPCSGTTRGVQICQADGTFSTCECGTTDAGGADAATLDDAATVADTGVLPDAGGDGGTDAASAHLYYAGSVGPIGPVWATAPGAAGLTGLAAGQAICQTIGADHACDYEELLLADAASETLFRAIPAGTSGWVQRTTHALVGGVDSAPGPGGNCNDWTYATNHIGDGEYVTFASAGTPTFHLDNDTTYDVGGGGAHIILGDLECGGVTRMILCCNAAP